jgi:hypothetical protein
MYSQDRGGNEEDVAGGIQGKGVQKMQNGEPRIELW